MKAQAASSTALLIARAVLLAEARADWRSMLPPGSAELTRAFLRDLKTPLSFKLALHSSALRGCLARLERALLPGVWLHWLVRKSWIDEVARAAIASGCQQLVVLGAGLDSLAWRWQSAVAGFEIDHPATQALKLRSAAIADAPRLIPLDLEHASAAQRLRAEPCFSQQRPTLFIAEGLLMYLEPQRVASLLAELAALAAPGSRLCFTFMEKLEGRPLGFHHASPLINRWLRWRQEPFRWGLMRAKAATFIAGHGWDLMTLSEPEDWRRRILAPHGLEAEPLAVGESALLAQRANS